MSTKNTHPGLAVIFSQSAEYALRAVVHLASRQQQDSMAAHEIASSTGVPLSYLHKILRMLVRAGILSGQRGQGGGFSLGRAPSDINVLDVLRATDASIERISRCPLGITGHTELCSLHRTLDAAIADVEARFRRTAIRDLLPDGAHGSALCVRRKADSRAGRESNE